MKDKMTRNFCITGALLILFFMWTMVVSIVDVQPIGPNESEVGLAAMNGWFHHLTGKSLALYELTDYLSVLPLAIVGVFGLVGVIQLIKRKSLAQVDSDIIALGAFYLIVLACYGFFEVVVINYRPILIDGSLEASYPSSTTLLSMAVFPTAALQVNRRLRSKALRAVLIALLLAFTVFMVATRLISGVHWLSDIIGGLLLSSALIMGYVTMLSRFDQKDEEKKQERSRALHDAMDRALSPDNF